MTLSEAEIEKIKTHYKVEYIDDQHGDGHLRLNGERVFACSVTHVYLKFGKNTEDPKECTTVAVRDLYRTFFPEFEAKDLIDERSEKHLNAVKKNIGLLETKNGYDGMIKEDEKPDDRLDIWHNDTDLKKLADGKWVAETVFSSMDDYTIVDYIFDHKPNENEVRTAFKVDEIERHLTFHPSAAVFQCWECGMSGIHWLDGEGDLEQKWNNARARYCGC